MDVRIGEVVSDVVVTDNVANLTPQDLRTIIKKVLDHLEEHQARVAQRERDITINDRVFQRGMKR